MLHVNVFVLFEILAQEAGYANIDFTVFFFLWKAHKNPIIE